VAAAEAIPRVRRFPAKLSPVAGITRLTAKKKKKTTYRAAYFLYRWDPKTDRTSEEYVARDFATAKTAAKHIVKMLNLNDEDNEEWIKYPSLSRVRDGLELHTLELQDEEDRDVLDWFLDE